MEYDKQMIYKAREEIFIDVLIWSTAFYSMD